MTEFWIGVVVGVLPTFLVTRWITEVRGGKHEALRAWRRRKSYRDR